MATAKNSSTSTTTRARTGEPTAPSIDPTSDAATLHDTPSYAMQDVQAPPAIDEAQMLKYFASLPARKQKAFLLRLLAIMVEADDDHPQERNSATSAPTRKLHTKGNVICWPGRGRVRAVSPASLLQ